MAVEWEADSQRAAEELARKLGHFLGAVKEVVEDIYTLMPQHERPENRHSTSSTISHGNISADEQPSLAN